MNPDNIARIASTHCKIGENPLWYSGDLKLYWCDIPHGRLHRYCPGSGQTETVRDGSEDGSMIGGFTIEADGALLLFMNDGRITRWSGGQEQSVIEGIVREKGGRFNDVIADPDGRVFCGAMSIGRQPGRLYRLDLNRSLHTIMPEVGCPNGLAFDRNGKKLFFTDSFAYTIYVYDYDRTTGGVENRRVFLRTDPKLGFPDGLTVDAENCLWSAAWDGACVVRYDPNGRETMRLALRTPKVASLTFGGEDLSTLFITTAIGEALALHDEHAGSLFAAYPGVRGAPEFRSRICCTNSMADSRS